MATAFGILRDCFSCSVTRRMAAVRTKVFKLTNLADAENMINRKETRIQ